MDAHDSAALAHYEQLIAARYPPHLAAALAAARYSHALANKLTITPIDASPRPAAAPRRVTKKR